jgi:hypothetical protein
MNPLVINKVGLQYNTISICTIYTYSQQQLVQSVPKPETYKAKRLWSGIQDVLCASYTLSHSHSQPGVTVQSYKPYLHS